MSRDLNISECSGTPLGRVEYEGFFSKMNVSMRCVYVDVACVPAAVCEGYYLGAVSKIYIPMTAIEGDVPGVSRRVF